MLKPCKRFRAPGLLRRITTSLSGILCAATLLANAASAQTLFILTNDGQLATLTTANPAANTPPVTIAGLVAGETLVAIDVRPQTQRLYGLGVNAAANTATLYHIAPETGFAAVVGTVASSIAFVDAMGDPVDFPNPASATWDIDFNPTVDRIRVVTSTGLNFRINPNNGAPVDGNGGLAGVNPDGAINGPTTSVHGTAYTNSQPAVGVTTQYTVDATTNSLYIQNPPNNGTQSNGIGVTLGGAALDFTDVRGFDIMPGVNAPGASQPVTTGSAILIANVGGITSVYSLDLPTGQATLLGTPALAVRSSAIRTQLGVAMSLSADGSTLLRFDPADPSVVTTVAISGVTAGEQLAGFDARPQTGQIYALGVNAGANTATLYLLDPQTGTLTPVGATGQISYVDASGDPVDFPPVSLGYGFDFNPTVDRIRVVTGTGLNFRLNPNNGAPVDGDGILAGVNPDGALNVVGNLAIGVSATAYTNSFGRDLGVAGAVTTQYSLNTISGTLYIQNPPNAGTLVNATPLSMGNLGTLSGFDIPASVTVSVSNQPATGRAWLLAEQGAASHLFRLDLASGALDNVGTLAVARGNGLVVFSSAPPIILAEDRVTVTGGPTRLNPLANDGLDASAEIVFVSDPSIVIQGRSLVIPAGYNGTFTYEVRIGASTGVGTVTVVAGTPASQPTRFSGLLLDPNGSIAGSASLAISSQGVATVQLRGGTQTSRARAVFPPAGNTATAFTNAGNLTLVRQPDGTIQASLAALGGSLTGTLRAAASTATAAKYHIALASIDVGFPGGAFAVGSTTSKGAVSIRGVLPDGLAFSAPSVLSDDGSIAFYTVVTQGARPPAVLAGELVTADLATTDITGEVIYHKLAQSGSRGLHLDGVDTILTANGSLYAGTLIGDGDGILRLSGGNLAADEELAVAVSSGIPATPAGSLSSWRGVKASVGTFTARITVPNVNKPVTGRGVYLPKSNRAWGFFPGTTVGGRIELSLP